nr:phosphatidylglycerol lysyltransferase domain-containing protein [uncultured Gellertiella sp.]
MAYSTAVQPDLLYHGDAHGYLAFAEKMGYVFVLGDPVAAAGEGPAYLRRFLTDIAEPCFVQIGAETAFELSKLGFRINRLGVETHLTLADSMFAGTRNQSIRYSERWLTQRGYQLLECTEPAATGGIAEAISEEWRRQRIVSRREMRFLNRPFQPVPGPDMRRFILRDPDGGVVALLDFDPIYGQGEVVGYTTAFKRKRSGTTPHAEIALTKFAADRFLEEGKARVSLGLSPLAGICASGFAESAGWRFLFRRAFQSKRVNEGIFNLQGQAAFKRRFHGQETPSYIAFRSASPLRMLALLRLLKTLPSSGFLSMIFGMRR